MRNDRRGIEIARAALELFFAVAGKFEASDADQAALLGVSNDFVQRYRTGERLPKSRETLERISHVTSIWLALTSIFGSESDALLWLRSPNQTFNGTSPFERMLAGKVSDLADVCSDIEAIHIV